MEDPKYNDLVKVGSNSSTYQYQAFPRGATGGLQSSQSFILELQFEDEQTPAQPFDISGATATLYVTAYNSPGFPKTMLAAGVLSDSGGGTTDTVTFTVSKDNIPDELGNIAASKVGNSAFFLILEDADTKLQFYQTINVIDESFALTGENTVSENIIVAGGNDLGTVINVGENTPPVTPNFLDAYIVGVGTGDWLGLDDNLVVWNGLDWVARLPETGNFVFNETDTTTYRYTGVDWGAFTPADGTITQAKLAPGFTLPDNNVTNVQLDDMAQDTIKGRVSSGAGDPEDLTTGQVRTILAISNVDNTSDIDKPISTAQQSAISVKLDATAQASDSLKYGGLDIDTANISNGRVLAAKASLTELEFVDQSAGGGGGNGVALPFIFSNDITATDPTSGGIKFDSATIGSITEIYVSYTSNNNVDATLRINSLVNNGFYIQQLDDDANFIEVNVDTVTDNTGWATLGVTLQSTGTIPANATTVGVDFNFYSSAGVSVSSVFGRSGAVAASAGDYALSQITNDSTEPGAFGSDAIDSLSSNKMSIADYDAAGISEQVVGLTAAQSLTNKDINGVTLTSSGAATQVLYDDGLYRVPPGSTGGEANDGANTGLGDAGIYKDKTGITLNFKDLIGGTNCNITSQTDTVTINATGESNAASNLAGDEGIFAQKNGIDLELKSLTAGTDISLVSDANTITINSTATGESNTTSNTGAGAQVAKAKSGTDLPMRSIVSGDSSVTITQNTDDIDLSFSVDNATDTNFTSKAIGDLQYWDGTDWVNLAAGTSSYVLTSNGAGVAPSYQAGGGGGGAVNWDFTSSSTTAAAGEKHILSGSGTVLTFPAAPADGTQIECIRDDSSNAPAVARGGSDTINGVITNMNLDTDQGRTTFIYDSGNTNWRAYNV